MTWCPWPTFHAPPTLSKFYVKSRNKVHFSATVTAVIAGSMKPCIVIVLINHTIWHGALNLHFMLHRLCQNFMLSLEIKCISLQYSWEYETLQRNCAWHTLWAHTMTRCISLCSSNGFEYESLHSGCPWHTFQAHTMTIFAWPTLHAVVISRNSGAISTSAEFLLMI